MPTILVRKSEPVLDTDSEREARSLAESQSLPLPEARRQTRFGEPVAVAAARCAARGMRAPFYTKYEDGTWMRSIE